GQRRERAGAGQELRGWGCRRGGPSRAAVHGPFLPRCGAPKGSAAAADKARGGGRRPPPPATEEEMAPRNLWQVYALGAFIVLRWAWAKWKENQDRNDSDSPDGDGGAPDRST
ncbi:hypothetical protein PVAP13_5KG777200, partial [Panicum virgatum]